MELDDEERLIKNDKEEKEYQDWLHKILPTEITEGTHRHLFYFGRCVCGVKEDTDTNRR
jgi:endonuclease III